MRGLCVVHGRLCIVQVHAFVLLPIRCACRANGASKVAGVTKDY